VLTDALIDDSRCVFKGDNFSSYLAVNLILPFIAGRFDDMKIPEQPSMAGAMIVTIDVYPPIDNLRELLPYEGVSTLFAAALDVSSNYHFTSPSTSLYGVRNGVIQNNAALNLKHDALRLRVIDVSALVPLTARKENEAVLVQAKIHELEDEIAEHRRASGESEKEIAAHEREVADVREQLRKLQEVKHSLEQRIATQGSTIQTLEAEVERANREMSDLVEKTRIAANRSATLPTWMALGLLLAVTLFLFGFVRIRRGRRYPGLIPSAEHREN